MGDWREVAIVSLQVIAAVSAALFAVLALFTEYKEGGKVTFYGRVAVIGIVVSALCALATQWMQFALDRAHARKAAVDAVIADANSRRQQAVATTQFYEQLIRSYQISSRLRDVGNRSRALQRDMQSSLRQLDAVLAGNNALGRSMVASLATQQDLRAQAERTLAGINLTRDRVDQGTVDTLRGMWNNANRIDPSGIQVILSYVCRVDRGGTPALLSTGAFAQIGLRQALWVDDDDFRRRVDFSPELAPLSVPLAAFQRELSTRRQAFFTPNDLAQTTTFSLFLPRQEDSNHVFRDPEAWRGGGVEVIISARPEMDEAQLLRRLRPWGGKESLAPTEELSNETPNRPDYSLPEQQRNDPRVRISVLPCETHLVLTVNGRTVVNENPKVLLISGWHFEHPTVLVRSYPRRIPPDTFPRFPDPREVTLPGMPATRPGGSR